MKEKKIGDTRLSYLVNGPYERNVEADEAGSGQTPFTILVVSKDQCHPN